MNRAERRAKAKATPAYRRGASAEELIKQMSRNGITPQQYDDWGREQYQKGFNEGYTQSSEETAKMVYAAFCLAAKEVFGFGRKRCFDLLVKADEHVTYHLHSKDAIEEVLQQIGLTIDFREPIDRVREVGP